MKWKEIQQQPNMLPGSAVPGCCLLSFHFLCDIHFINSVQATTRFGLGMEVSGTVFGNESRVPSHKRSGGCSKRIHFPGRSALFREVLKKNF